ncbi:Protein BREAST CANCER SUSCEPTIBILITY 1 homolog [Striga hermonthica]|uniref:Protein BREAST CANCER SUSCEPTIBILITY 1 homolog n=1 Tax=Striga hermonthica TaxID=68872 RepID=A0A9N7NND1_STRHE|nr:Protein BREAST CANCER SUSCEPTIBILITY 1 homolog [Striga hermonthica]
MGRELKCPICLSLLSSAVSLTCNHVFCNDCIDKSMKAASNCPVCKVPYRRREIRPAPHMDNLVSVYKSMEVAAGVNIFVTQTAGEPTKTSGEETQSCVDIHNVQDNGKTQVQKLSYTVKKQLQRQVSKCTTVSSQRSSQSNQEKPSFPAKKRVQVPPYQTSEAPTDQNKLEGISGETGRKQQKKSTVPQRDMSFRSEKGEQRLSPFFWLRDKDALEELSQPTDDNEVMYTPLDVPCFSDIKDSDDEAPCRVSQERGMGELPNRTDFFDSEMFDWTQRPCSPELCSCPLAMKVKDPVEESGNKQKVENDLKEITTEPKICLNKKKYLSKKRKNSKVSEQKNGIEMSNKKVSYSTENRKRKRAKKSLCEEIADHVESDMVITQNILEGNKVNPSISRGKPRKSKKVYPGASSREEKIPNVCDGTRPLPNNKDILTPSVSASENAEKINKTESKLKMSGESSKSTTKRLSKREKFGSRVKRGNSGTGNGNMTTEPVNNVLDPESCNKLLPTVRKEVLSRGITNTSTEESGKLPKSRKKVKFSADGTSKDICAGLTLNSDEKGVSRCKSHQESADVTEQIKSEVPPKMDKATLSLNGGILLKCNTSATFHCAFCQSSEESEATGSMVHYLNGKLVAENHNANKDAIHVHKNCTEWAPNVYFDNDNVINLEAELSRSKRIRCCCCGIKGAALGCYEKSCRKSFHVTCARLTPECRWDFENFVMLCPIHASSQLPNNTAQSQSSRKRKSAPENRKSSIHQAKASDECKSGSTMQWKTQKKLKSLVLCCSALTNTEKEVVTNFENLSGVTILKNWDPTITHIIASTDENGACRRTLKYLMGVLEGKWILSVEWIKACIETGEIVDETHYEISIDIHGIRDGPKLGRSRVINKQPKLFDGFSFFFTGDFETSYKGYLHDLVIAAGGKVLNRKPVEGEHSSSFVKSNAKTFIIYSIELTDHQSRPCNGSSILKQRLSHAESLARSSGAVVASNAWVLNSIAGHKLQELGD